MVAKSGCGQSGFEVYLGNVGSMVWNNFVVTAMGRSGTMFLAHTLDLSPTWSVKHEPPPAEH